MIKLKTTSLIERFKEYAALILKGGYIIDKNNENQFKGIINAFEEGKKGVLIVGSAGCGKTLVLKVIQKIISPFTDSGNFIIVSCQDVVGEFNINGHDSLRKYREKNIVFDDFGTETKGMYYGDRVEVMDTLIQMRYEAFYYGGKKTHFTTNLTFQNIANRYGSRCYSRLVEMVDPIAYPETIDNRKLNNFIGWVQVYHEQPKSEEDIKWEKGYNEYREKMIATPQEPIKQSEGIGTEIRNQINKGKSEEEISELELKTKLSQLWLWQFDRRADKSAEGGGSMRFILFKENYISSSQWLEIKIRRYF